MEQKLTPHIVYKEVQYRLVNACINSSNDISASCKNLNFSPATHEIMKVEFEIFAAAGQKTVQKLAYHGHISQNVLDISS